MPDPVLAVSVASGALIGTAMALTGAGGGILAVPLLMFSLGMTAMQAAPLGLMAVTMSAALGACMGLRAGTVRYRAALLAALVGLPMVQLGLWLAQRIDARLVAAMFAAVLTRVGIRMLWPATDPDANSSLRVPPCSLNPATGRIRWTSPCALALASAGAMAGLMSGMLGVGGGFVVVPALRRSTGLSMASIVPTSLAVVAMVSASGATASMLAGRVDWPIALPFCGASLAGMVMGRLFVSRMEGAHLNRIFGAAALATGAALLYKIVYASFT